MNKMSLKNEYENLADILSDDLHDDAHYNAGDVFDIILTDIPLALEHCKDSRKILESHMKKFVAKNTYPGFYYNHSGQFMAVEKYIYKHQAIISRMKNKSSRAATKESLFMYHTLNRAFMNYFLKTRLIKRMGIGDEYTYFMETELGHRVFTHPEIYLDRFFRDNVYTDYVPYIPLTDIIAPLLKPLNDFIANKGLLPKYNDGDVDAHLGLVFIYYLSNKKRFKQFSKQCKGKSIQITTMQYVMILMIVITDFLNYCEPKRTNQNDRALHDLMIGWLKACNIAYIAFKFSDKIPKK